MNAAVDTVLFDLGKVLIDYDHWTAVSAFASLSASSPRRIHDTLFASALTRSFEEGALSPPAFFRNVKNELGLDVGFARFCRIWNEIFFIAPHNRQTLRIARSLRARYRICILSNINRLHLDYIRANFPVFAPFHRVFASCELGSMKPDRRIYGETLAELDAAPGEVFYTDDRVELVEAARRMGIRGYAYAGPGRLRRDLKSCGISC